MAAHDPDRDVLAERSPQKRADPVEQLVQIDGPGTQCLLSGKRKQPLGQFASSSCRVESLLWEITYAVPRLHAVASEREIVAYHREELVEIVRECAS